MAALKNTPLIEFHREMGAKMVPVSGWNLPFQFPDGVIAEHLHTRRNVSIFDSCSFGKLRVAGVDPSGFDRLFARPSADLAVNCCRRNLMLNPDGGVFEEVRICRMAERDFLLIVPPGGLPGLAARLRGELPGAVEFQDLTESLARIDLCGPDAAEALGGLGADPSALPGPDGWSSLEVDGIRAVATAFDEFGIPAYQLMFDAEYADQIWALLLDRDGVAPAGTGAADTLRLEAGRPARLHEFHPEWTPFDSGDGVGIDPAGAREFIGRQALAARPPTRRMIGVVLEGRRASRPGSAVMTPEEEIIGVVTSGSYCPSLERAAALCSVEIACRVPAGTRLLLESGAEKLPGTVVEPPFLRPENGGLKC